MAPSTRSKTAVKRKRLTLPSLNSIYRNDLFTLLNRRQLETAREVSRRFNNAIRSWSDERGKPRHHLHEFTIGTKSCRLKKNGELDKSTAAKWKDWRKVSNAAGCCRELEAPSRQLAGQLLYSSRPETDFIAVTVEIYSMTELIRNAVHDARHGDGEDVMGMKERFITVTPNRLSEEGAFDVLHLLKHINGVFFDSIDIEGHRDDGHCLNTQLFSLLSKANPTHVNRPYRLFADIVQCQVKPLEGEDCTQLYLTSIRSYQRFARPRFYSGEVTFKHESDLKAIIKLIACSAELGDEKLMLGPVGADSNTLENIIKCCRDELTGLMPRIAEFAIVYRQHKKLPPICDPALGQRVELHPGAVEVAFEFTNVQERRSFRAIFELDVDGFHGLMRVKFDE